MEKFRKETAEEVNTEVERDFAEQNYYERLGISPYADEEEIKDAFKELAKVCHPDIGEGDEEKFKLLSEAYTTLKKPEERIEYDLNEMGPEEVYRTAEHYLFTKIKNANDDELRGILNNVHERIESITAQNKQAENLFAHFYNQGQLSYLRQLEKKVQDQLIHNQNK